MATQDLYEQWEKRVELRGEARGEARGETKGLVQSLVGAYEQRFGVMPLPLRKALARKVSAESIGQWVILFATAPASEIASAIRKSAPPR